MIHTEKFKEFFGVVENNVSPGEDARLQVRIFGYHDANKNKVPTEDLPWFSVATSNSTNVSGKGWTPLGYQKGTTVYGYVIGDDYQNGIVLCALSGRTGRRRDPNSGFSDPSGVLPEYDVGESDVNRLARNDSSSHWLNEAKNSSKDISEPAYQNNSVYPHNMVYESPNGIVIELDDTPSNQRIHVYHPSGSYVEIKPNGDTVMKSKNKYDITVGDNVMAVRGNLDIKVDGDVNIKASNIKMNADRIDLN